MACFSLTLASIPGSIKSSFQLRTFDPEGVIFYGDTKKGLDWFILSLKDGVPLMQIYKAGVHVSVAGGATLSDGKWHTVRGGQRVAGGRGLGRGGFEADRSASCAAKVEVSNNGNFVILEVDGSNKLVVGMNPGKQEEVLPGELRLALGGVLIPTDRMTVSVGSLIFISLIYILDAAFVASARIHKPSVEVSPFPPQVEPRLDGCVRKGSWLNLSIPWESDADDLWPCYQNLRPGSYFPGTGFAIFNTSGGNKAPDADKSERFRNGPRLRSEKARGFSWAFNSFNVLLQSLTWTPVEGLRWNCLPILARWMEPF